jgi:hypothetical protein
MDAVRGHPRLGQPHPGGLFVAGDVPAVQHQLFAHVLGEPGHLHRAAGPGDVGVRGNVVGRGGDVVQGGHPIHERLPQVGVPQVAQRALAFLEAAGADGFAFQVRAQHPGQLLGVAGLMDHPESCESRTVQASHQVPASGRRWRTASTKGCHSGNRSASMTRCTAPGIPGATDNNRNYAASGL